MRKHRASGFFLMVMCMLTLIVGGCSSEAPKEGVKPHKDSYKTYPGQRPPGAPGGATDTKAP